MLCLILKFLKLHTYLGTPDSGVDHIQNLDELVAFNVMFLTFLYDMQLTRRHMVGEMLML